MPKRVFKKDFLIDVLYGDADGATLLEDNVFDSSRWSIYHEMIFKFEGKNYTITYSEGATESQDEGPFERSENEIECTEVEQVEIIKKVWRAV